MVNSINGTQSVESITVQNTKTDASSELKVDGIFIAVGTVPNTQILSGLVQMDDKGYVVADETCKTTCPGVFVAGDVRTKPLRQVLTATADGANAITSIQKYFSE